jgi:hypothetical protein
MALPHETPDNGIRFVDDEEWRDFFDGQARELVGMSGEEFLRRYNAGEYKDVFDEPEYRNALYLAMLRPERSAGLRARRSRDSWSP